MSQLSSLSLLDWTGLVAALFLFLGPGYALLSFYPDRREFDRTQTAVVSVCLAIAFWCILLVWLHALDTRLTPLMTLVVLGMGWVVRWFRARPWRIQRRSDRPVRIGHVRCDAISIALWGVFFLAVAVRLWAVWDDLVSLGIDSYHHTLIAQMIVERGILPDDYQPLAPIATFTYHFGFHGLVAAVAWLSGLETTVLVPLLGQILNAVAALSVAFFTQVTTRSRGAAMVSAAFTGLVLVFPAFFVNWSRYPQLGGLVILPVFLGMVWHWVRSTSDWSLVPFIGILAAGTALVHYRIALMAAVAVPILLGLDGLIGKVSREVWTRIVGRLLLAALIAGALTMPWVWHVLSTRQSGYPVHVGVVSPEFFRLDRLGIEVLRYPTNNVSIGLVLVAIIVGWWRRERIVILLSVWTAVILFVSTPRFAGILLDTISVIASLYFPASVAIGWMTTTLVDWLATWWRPVRYIAWIGLLSFLVWGSGIIGSIVQPVLTYVRGDDWLAMEWMRQNTPSSAYFMVNTYHWGFLPDFVVGADAGYWIPVLASRRTVIVPMIYVLERSSEPDLVARMVSLDQLGGHLTSPEALALLRRDGITHVYIGERGGPIVLDELLDSPAFELEYQNGAAYVFRLE